MGIKFELRSLTSSIQVMCKVFGCVAFVLILANTIERANGDEYVPGTPGKVWDEYEIRIVREKIIHMLDAA